MNDEKVRGKLELLAGDENDIRYHHRIALLMLNKLECLSLFILDKFKYTLVYFYKVSMMKIINFIPLRSGITIVKLLFLNADAADK